LDKQNAISPKEGAYNRSRGSQEENTVTHCTAAVSLTIHADPKPIMDGNPCAIKTWINTPLEGYKGQYPIRYRPGHHIPPGGTYFCKTKLLNHSLCDCFMIASASADFRTRTLFRPEAEAEDFTDDKSDDFTSPYNTRILLDMEAVCLTAVAHKIDCLILGATGCGCFQHDPKTEAKLWKHMIYKYGPYFDEIVFSIMDRAEGENVIAFKNEFDTTAML